MSDVVRRWAVLATAVAQVALSFWLFAAEDRPFEPGPGGPSPAEPAGYAFAIWGPIYLAALALAVFQFRAGPTDQALLRRIGWPVAVAFAATSAWLLFARFGPLWATAGTILLMLLTLGWSFAKAAQAPEPTRARRWLVIAPLALFTGWITAATFVNVSEVLPRFGFDRFGLDATAYAVWGVVLPAAATAVLFLAFTRYNFVYAGTLIWALVAVVAANQERGTAPLVQTAALVAVAALVSVALAGQVLQRRIRVK